MDHHAEHVEAIASLARSHGFGIGVAESLTSGQVAADLGAGPQAASWFRGGLVAYASEVKFDVLGVRPGPVVSEECARQMAWGVASLLDADAVVATTGVGGPDPDEGEPPGTCTSPRSSAGARPASGWISTVTRKRCSHRPGSAR